MYELQENPPEQDKSEAKPYRYKYPLSPEETAILELCNHLNNAAALFKDRMEDGDMESLEFFVERFSREWLDGLDHEYRARYLLATPKKEPTGQNAKPPSTAPTGKPPARK